MSNIWAYGLFGCFANCCLCIKTYFLPCLVYGRIAQGIDKPCCLHVCFFFIPVWNVFVMTKTRGAIRDKQGIVGGFCGDLVLTLFCPFCTLAQEAQEIGVMTGEEMVRS